MYHIHSGFVSSFTTRMSSAVHRFRDGRRSKRRGKYACTLRCADPMIIDHRVSIAARLQSVFDAVDFAVGKVVGHTLRYTRIQCMGL